MAQMPPLRTIANKTPADATDPEYNFDTIENHLATEVINRDGSVAMTGPLVLPGPATQANQAATLGQLGASLPTAVMLDYGGDTLPDPDVWAFCDGSPQSSTDPKWAPLFSKIGFKYGDAGGGNFNLPDFRERVAVGRGDPGSDVDTVGITGGVADAPVVAHVHQFIATHNHTSPSHDHAGPNHRHSISHTHSIDPPSESTSTDTHSHGVADGFATMGAFGSLALDRHDGGSAYNIGVDVFSHDAHNHSVNIGAFTSGGSSAGVSGYAGTNDTGGRAATINSTTIDKDTESTGSSGDGANYPPFVVCTKIIRI